MHIISYMWLQVVHVDMLHVLLNVCSLWGLAPVVEEKMERGSIAYLTTTIQLALLSSVVSRPCRAMLRVPHYEAESLISRTNVTTRGCPCWVRCRARGAGRDEQ